MPMTVAEFKAWLATQPDGEKRIADIFYTTDLRLPAGVKVPRPEAQIQKWLDGNWLEGVTDGSPVKSVPNANGLDAYDFPPEVKSPEFLAAIGAAFAAIEELLTVACRQRAHLADPPVQYARGFYLGRELMILYFRSGLTDDGPRFEVGVSMGAKT